ncbi:hypothetical protein GCM10010185_52570 [Saccharothrix coeruleofusca]|uniref:Uncharacterized protein n=1 Tax=Saccharothrix coeruleofusca TaxID=33919 RepID=A0A918EFG3_9PSEU|nr:hypothetical protein GCM10010185_52570 [Saccharothrix coeruleofusca]
MDGLGQAASTVRTAAEFAQDAPGLELGVGAFTRSAQAGVGAVGLFLGLRLVLAFVRGDDVVACLVVAEVPPITRRVDYLAPVGDAGMIDGSS